MPREMKDVYREFLHWNAVAVELQITPKYLALTTIDRCHLDIDGVLYQELREKRKCWEVLVKVPL